MDKSIQITLIIVGAVLVLALLGGYAFFQVFPGTGNTISSQGNSQIKVIPDLVTIYFTVDTNGTTSKEANDANSLIVDDLITALVKLGFNRDEIQTQSFNINPNSYWNGRDYVTNGFKANHQIKIELSTSQTDKIGDVIDAGINSGASINYINFELSVGKQNEYKAQALQQATEDAKNKATAIATGAGMKLGKLVSISTNDFYYQPWRMYGAVDSMNVMDAKVEVASTSIQPGSQDVTASVSVVYKIN